MTPIRKLTIIAAATLFTALAVQASTARAAVVSAAVQNVAVTQDQTVHVSVSLNTQGQRVNTVSAEIFFSSSTFSLEKIEDGSSSISFWVTPPGESSPGVIDLAGIIPGGFSGAGGPLISFDLQPIATGMGTIQVATATVLESDGLGTPLPVTLEDVAVNIAPSVTTSTESEPNVDYIAPNPFVPQVVSNPNIFGGKYFLVFSATDNGSGIDYYQVLEVPSGASQKSFSLWHNATSPYLLIDQSLSSDIYVRAIDHSGNFIVVKVPAQHPSSPWNIWNYAIVAIVIIVFVLSLWIWDRRRKRR